MLNARIRIMEPNEANLLGIQSEIFLFIKKGIFRFSRVKYNDQQEALGCLTLLLSYLKRAFISL